MRLHTTLHTSLALAAVLAMPALAGPRTLEEGAARVLDVVRSERMELEGIGGPAVRPAIRLLRQGERHLTRLDRAFDKSADFDVGKMRLVARAGAAIWKADATGGLSADATVVPEYVAWLEACAGDVDALATDAAAEVDRLLDPKFRAKAARRLEKGRLLLDDAFSRPDADDRAAGLARALPHLRAALAKAIQLCLKETTPRCPRGATASNTVLGYRGRGVLTVYDMSWVLELRLANGSLYAERSGQLSDIANLLERPLPWTLRRGERIDALDTGAIERGFQVDGTLTWRTSVGEIVVPVHLDR